MAKRQSKNQAVTLRVSAYNSYLPNLPEDFEPPLANYSDTPAAFYGFWRMMEGALKLPDPRSFPALRVASDAEAAVLRRFIETCQDLAGFNAISYNRSYSLELGEGAGLENFTRDFPPRESIIAVVTLFRQLYAHGEVASFVKVSKIIGSLTHRNDPEGREVRTGVLKTWRDAHGLLLNNSLERLADLEGARLIGHFPPEPTFMQDESSSNLLHEFMYGDLIHWGKYRDEHSAFFGDTVLRSMREWEFLNRVAQLSHFYFGYSLVVEKYLPI